MTLQLIKVDLTDHLGSIWNILLHKIAPYSACMEKKEIQIHNTVYKSNEKNLTSKNPPPQNMVPHLMFIIWIFIAIFFIEYNLIAF